jgi:hypothetical protein
MGAGASAEYKESVDAVGSEALSAAYENLSVDDKKAFRKTFKHDGLPAAIEGSNDEVKAGFEDVSPESRQTLADALREKIRTHTFQRHTAKLQEKLDDLKKRQEECEDEEKKAKMSEHIERMEAKLNERNEAGPPEPLPKDEKKANCQARYDETMAKAAEAREAGKKKKAERLEKRAGRLEGWLSKFDDDSSCPSDCASCVDGSHSDCSDANCCEHAEE